MDDEYRADERRRREAALAGTGKVEGGEEVRSRELFALRTTGVTYPGNAEHIRTVRADLRPLLRDCPVADNVILCASELAANAALHSRIEAKAARPQGSGCEDGS